MKDKVKVGKYRTRNHLEAYVIYTEMPSMEAPVLGYVMNKMGIPSPATWAPCGSVMEGRSHPFDLVEEWRDQVKYSLDLWFHYDPAKATENTSLANHVFGLAAACNWSNIKLTENHRKYRITVEEVQE